MKQFFSSINLAVFWFSLCSCQQYIKNYFIIYKLYCLFQLRTVKFKSCYLPQANLLQHFIHFQIRKRQVQKPQPSSISFHLYGIMITLGGQMKKTGNAYGVINVFKESMLLRLLLTYWGRMIFILKVVMLLKINLIQQDTKNFGITNILGRVFFLIIQKLLEHPLQVYMP